MRAHFNQKRKLYKRAVSKVKISYFKIFKNRVETLGIWIHESTSVAARSRLLRIDPILVT